MSTIFNEVDLSEEARLRANISTMTDAARVFGIGTAVGRRIDTLVLLHCERLTDLAGLSQENVQ